MESINCQFFLRTVSSPFKMNETNHDKSNFIQIFKSDNDIFTSFLTLSKTLKGGNLEFYKTRDHNIKKLHLLLASAL